MVHAIVHWDSLTVYTLGGEEVRDAKRRRVALDAFRRNGGLRDYYLGLREPGGGSTWGPSGAHDIDWTGFAPSLPLSIDLYTDAEAALARGEMIRVERVPHHAGSMMVETLIVGNRAGQATDGDAVWGDWDEEKRIIRTNGGRAIQLDGREGEPQAN